MNEDDYKWGDGEPMPGSASVPAGYIPNTPPPVFRLLPRATELIQQRDERVTLSLYASLETLIPGTGRPNRYCYPFTPVSPTASGIRTEEQLVESALNSARTAVSVRTIQLVDKIKASLPKWGDHHQKAEGDGFHQLQEAYNTLYSKITHDPTGSPSRKLSIVGNPDRLREIKPKSLLSEYCFIEERCMAELPDKTVPAWPDDLVLIVCMGSKADYRSYKHNTLRIAFEERMVVEAKTGPDGLQGRIVECYTILEPNPEFAFALTW